MEQIFVKVLNMSAAASVVIAVVLIFRLLLRRAPKKYSYLLWLAVAFRLLCPVSLSSVFSVFALQPLRPAEGVMASGSPELGERTVGLVGFGDIAQAVARRLRPFGCSLFYYAPHRRPPEVEAGFGISYLPLEELFARCDLISLHCAVTPETRGMVDAALLERVRPGTILINTARGDLLDNLAVRQALIEGRLGGAGFDVLSPEPTPADHPLVDLPPEVRDRVVYAPHLGGITSASFRRSHAWMWDSVRAMLEGGRPNNLVNGL